MNTKKISVLSEKQIHKAGRIDQVLRDYFANHKSLNEIPAKDLMTMFIEKGLFLKDHTKGLPIRRFLRQLDAACKLSLLQHIKVVRKDVNSGWFFARKV